LKALAPNRFRLAVAPVDFTFEAGRPGDRIKLTVGAEDGKPDAFSAVPPFAPSEAELQEYAGAYSSEEIDPLYTLKVEQGRLVIHRLKDEPDKLLPVTRDVFLTSGATVRFMRGAKGEINGFLLTTGRIRNMRFNRGRLAIAAL
jgi:hypothetical protein